ncbi:hypothetical protein KKJ17_19320 [Xenorhabdus bovienii]|uniref:hypothetical protein n=1 Tax=Xenorhabdus bovienii TaxID=40576 RepID=UPI0023B28F94|nr:hypothetical protein [Xenorhabdus bovienii]MDE9519796.1 hypothetical protein [Xenorhabdus bovienii]
MTIQQIQPERDQLGYWTHPDFLPNEEWTRDEIIQWLKQHNITMKTIMLEDEDTPIFERYESGDINVSDWNPTRPEGIDWFLVSIHLSEDGPACFWARHISQ